MTQVVHIANTNVELELSQPSSISLEQSLSNHPVCLQLQFLPFLYAQPEDIVAVTSLPPDDYLMLLKKIRGIKNLPEAVLLNSLEPFYGKTCYSWGASQLIHNWAINRNMYYNIPLNWNMLRLINSKEFSFRYTTLSEAVLIYSENELLQWVQSFEGSKVLKTCFGLSGQGNRRIEHHIITPEILNFCRKEWNQNRPIIGEPWLNRLYDFSTQWLIHQNHDIEMRGATMFETDDRGTYLGTIAGPEELLFQNMESFLKEHKQFIQKALEEIASLGFFGHIGIDAFVYRHPQSQLMILYPLVEINARETMSLVALRLQQQLCPNKHLLLSFNQKSSPLPLLPTYLVNTKGKSTLFRRNLYYTIVDSL